MPGISFGGMLDGGALALEDDYFDVVRAAGFDTVRLPVKWSAHATLDRVDRAVDGALRRDLRVIVDAHHFEGDLPALWARVAPRYADVGDQLRFELLNEPHEPMSAGDWNRLLPQAVAAVRAVSPRRVVIAGPARWNIVAALPDLRLPADDRLVVTVHYYSPFRFTHQGAHWLDGAAGWRGTRWGSDADRARVRADLERAAAWARARDHELFLGEFGTHADAPTADRAAWTAHVRSEAERLGVDWAYWDFGTEFGAYDVAAGAWREPLRRALLGS